MEEKLNSKPGPILPPPVSFALDPPRRPRVRRLYSHLRRHILTTSEGSVGGELTTESSGSSLRLDRFATVQGELGTSDVEEGRSGAVDEVVVEQQPGLAPEQWARAGAMAGAAGGSELGTATAHQAATRLSEAPSFKEASTRFGLLGRFYRSWLKPGATRFFYPKFEDSETEDAYQKELWWSSKRGYFYGALFFLFNWILQLSLVPRPWSIFLSVAHYGVGPLFCLPLIPFIAYDFPKKHRILWNIWLWITVYYASATIVIDLRLCDYYAFDGNSHCGSRDFISLLFYASAPPAVAMFVLGQSRLSSLLGFLAWIIPVFGMFTPSRRSFAKNIINLIVFYAFLLAASYQRDVDYRRLYTMRAELRIQYKAKQRAEMAERKSQDAQRRFSTYIFHEIRVPLNTALLAMQNLSSSSLGEKAECAEELAAMEGSLQMMSQVLNDTLDHNRMERGGFSSVSRPFSLHNVMRSVVSSVELAAAAKGLTVESKLDSAVDEAAKRAMLEDEEATALEGEGIVMGDEMRVRQIISNLTGNATKFTQAGGKVSIRTRLIYRTAEPTFSPSEATAVSDTSPAPTPASPRLSRMQLERHNSTGGVSMAPSMRAPSVACKGEVIVVRFEIEDTGCGVRPSDMGDNRLFSAYVQTAEGRQQGGKGTGLGLSLVRQITALSGGRLGVKSQVGVGSTFWCELPFFVGPQTRTWDLGEGHRRVSSNSCIGQTFPPSRKHSSSFSSSFGSAITPSASSSYSDSTEYNFGKLWSPGSGRASGDGLPKIDESHGAIEMLSTSTMPTPVLGGRSTVTHSPLSFYGSTLRSPPLLSPPTPTAPPSSPAIPSISAMASPAASVESSPSPPALPRAVSTTSTATATSSNSKAIDFQHGPLHVLVVDDDALTRKLMARLLTRFGCIVDSAENGAIAVDKVVARQGTVEEPSFSIIFLDNQMPVLSGPQTVQQLRKLRGKADLVVGCTANALIADQEEFIACGADAVLTKPIQQADLSSWCQRADQRRAPLNSSPLSSRSLDSQPAVTPHPLYNLPRSPAPAHRGSSSS